MDFLPQSKDTHVGLISKSKLSVNVRTDCYLSLCVGPVMNWQLVRGVPPPAGTDSSTPAALNA